jgi:hypothetical protein
MYTPMVPDVGGLIELDPLKFKPVPHGSRLEDNVMYTSLDPTLGLIAF